ncbi:MAG: helix-turn-helix domain-containing protein [Bacteroidales bacterium]|nr:helix-turn-helix domain-containing protein [Bacteroidales bacterium]
MSKPNLSIIREIAKAQNVSLKSISEKLGISPAALQNIMRNNGTSLETLGKIAEVLNVSVGVFFNEVNKAEKILAIFDKVFAKDKKRTDNVVEAFILASRAYQQMGADKDPVLQKKFLEYQKKQLNDTLGNRYMDILFDMSAADLKQLVTLGYISEDVCKLIEFAQKNIKYYLTKEK